MKRIALIDAALLERVTRLAAGSPRLRKNHNFHVSEAERCGRLLNAVEPGSYVRPHCHIDASMDESILVVHGRVGVLEFDTGGKVTGNAVLEPGGKAIGINVPHGTFHSLVALLPGTVFFEAKAGPYAPLSEEEKAAWAPAEGSDEAARYLEWMRSQFDCD
jgi:cupin fold WbuC family metalloprotein